MISGSTTVAAVIGDPVRHSLSPAIHNAAFAATGIDWVYVALPVPAGQGAAALDAMRSTGIGGLSVTMPHKSDVVAAVDEVSDAVAALGAANCIVARGDGRLRAENTDGEGFLRALADDANTDVAGRRIVVLGAGGAARAVTRACAEAGAGEVIVVNRTHDNAEVCAALAGAVGRVGATDDISGADVVINATPMGMASQPGMACDPSLLRVGQIVVDLIYDPAETEWMAASRRDGVETYGGLSMLVHQAALAFTLWTGLEAPLAAMREGAARIQS